MPTRPEVLRGFALILAAKGARPFTFSNVLSRPRVNLRFRGERELEPGAPAPTRN